ncbi:hypothetical protein MKS85_08720 [Pseudomonas sp. JL2]|uniref:hypothetical protein n=1 Tax=Pseudomonas sp. JL2 TaxID=2919942 RepID=UPI002865ECBA|nr:hypothetical protein [Pseudomonas sp. JL2]MDR8385613.1 hypothetical protein [Pseudomonas sp. JL2]
MSDRDEALANAIELLVMNQNGIGAAVEELAKWVSERGSVDVADSTVTALQALDLNAEGIASAIRILRREQSE